MQIRVRNFLLVQLDQDVLLERLKDQKFVFPMRAVAPENVFRFRERSDFVHPIEYCLVGWPGVPDAVRRKDGRCWIFHETKMFILTMNPPSPRLWRDKWIRIKTNPKKGVSGGIVFSFVCHSC